MDDLLVAYEREDGTYTVHETTVDDGDLPSLAGALTSETPFGGPDRHNLWAKMAIEALRWDDSKHLRHLLGQTERPPTPVRVEPVACGVDFEELRNERLDYRRVRGLLVVATDFAVTAYRTAWLSFADPHHGALVQTEWHHGQTTRERCFDGGFLAVRAAVSAAGNGASGNRAAPALERGLRALVDDSGAVLVTDMPAERSP